MLKIGLVTGEYPPMQGGVGDFSREVSLALAALGHRVHIITHAGAGADARPAPTIHPIIRSWNLPSLFLIRRLARSLSLDIVNIQYQAAAYGMTPPIHCLPLIIGAPSVVTFHDLRVPYLFPKAGALRRTAVNFLARSATGVIVTNPDDLSALQRDPRIKRVIEIPIGSNVTPNFQLQTPKSAIRNLQSAIRNPVVGYFGFLNASKGGGTLLRALAALPDCKLLLIGGRTGSSDKTNAAFADEIESLAASLGVADRITRTGFLPPRETTEAFWSCDVMAMPYVDGVSFRRGTFMACLAHGMPTITTRPATPLPELRDGENIRLVPPEDPAALAAAIRELTADPALRARLSAGALALADNFTWDKIAARTVDFLSMVILLKKGKTP
ncbi:MAG: glycosyltransferase family 4 protein [Chloroflexi bacterium]|nr:glycosyltransferase family 4 protein [Chloroflexota bacterium]